MNQHGVIELVDAAARASLLLVLTFAFTGVALAARGGIPGPPGGNGGGDDGGGGGTSTACFVKTANDCPIEPVKVDRLVVPSGWVKVLDEKFDQPTTYADRSGTIDYKRWSTRYPFGSWRNNTAGDDDMWNVNTTGLEPGVGWTDNHFPDMETFMNNLGYDGSGSEPAFDVFSRSDDGLVIQAHENPWKNRINGRENFLGGMISSHSNPDTGDPHGFEFTYGLVEARVRVPKRANGFRAALWLYSDNGYYNAVYGRPAVYEMDFMEYLPNTRDEDPAGEECFVPQPDVFGISANDNILTYDTIFHTYHFPGGRTPTNWTLNNDVTYDEERCALNGGVNSPIDFGSEDNGWATYSLLWQEDFIEWYVNGVLVHRVDEKSGETCSANLSNSDQACGVEVYDSRMYIIASMHMGNNLFEGSVDRNAFTPEGGPEFEIEYIHVYQDPDNQSWCGNGATTGSDSIDCSERR